MKTLLKAVCASGILFWSSSSIQAQSLAFIGDSISTGGASHPELAFDFDRLSKVFLDELSVAPDAATLDFLRNDSGIELGDIPPTRLGLSKREYTHPVSWVSNRFVTSVFSRYLDTEEYSWGFLLSRIADIRAQDVVIAARDGEKSLHARAQVDRILEANGGKAPAHTFILFTGNDLCAPDLQLATLAADYQKSIETAVRYFIANAKVEKEGGIAHIWMVDPVGLLQLVTSPSIAQKKIPAFGKTMTCSDLQAGRDLHSPAPIPATGLPPKLKDSADAKSPEEFEKESTRAGLRTMFDFLLSRGPQQLCPSLFASGGSTSQNQLELSELLQGYRKALDKIQKKLNNASPSFRVHHVKASSDVIFEGEDIGNDCFHLSARGQLKVAKAVFSEAKESLGK